MDVNVKNYHKNESSFGGSLASISPSLSTRSVDAQVHGGTPAHQHDHGSRQLSSCGPSSSMSSVTKVTREFDDHHGGGEVHARRDSDNETNPEMRASSSKSANSRTVTLTTTMAPSAMLHFRDRQWGPKIGEKIKLWEAAERLNRGLRGNSDCSRLNPSLG